MKIDFSTPIYELDGTTPALSSDTREAVTVGSICTGALLTPLAAKDGRGPEQLEGLVKIQYADLARKILQGGEVDVTAELVVVLKDRVNRLVPYPLIVAQVWTVLDPVAVLVKDGRKTPK